FLERLLAAIPGVTLERSETSRPAPGMDLAVYDQVAVPADPGAPWLAIAPPGGAPGITVSGAVDQPAVALLIARLLAQRLNVATTYLADLMHQYGGHGNHLSMVGELLQSMINLPPSQVSPGSDRQSDPRM
ncbi:MAG: hypothetical protein ABR585_15420, partial [Gemmatimonadaceae bacterium]